MKNNQKVKAFFNTSAQIQSIKALLEDLELYKITTERPQVDKLVGEKLSIVLYNQDGFIVYTSHPIYNTQSLLGELVVIIFGK